ncbi:hypothetical protein J6590_017414 [Homalodisca vitripennis]|nr:hypothetical protein J6590_017414 [Homalodisca vitripennis]
MAGLENENSVISVEGARPVYIEVNKKEGEQLLHLRQVVWNVLEYLVEYEGRPRDVEQYKAICQFRDDLLPVLADLTGEQGANIDFTESGELRTEPPSDRMQSG